VAQLEYCLVDGSIKNISEVLSGLHNYVCPICGEPLVAKKGNIVGHHFSHLPNSSCSAANYVHGETNLHLGMKKIIMETGLCRMPELDIDWNGNIINPNTLGVDTSYIRIKESDFYKFNKGYLEKKLTCANGKYIRPDFTCYDVSYEEMFGFNSYPCSVYLEVTVTHGVDDVKLDLIKSIDTSNFYVVEYDLSKVNRDSTYEELKQAYLSGNIPCNWIHRSGENDLVYDRYYESAFRVTNGVKWYVDRFYDNLTDEELDALKDTNLIKYIEQKKFKNILENKNFNGLNLTRQWTFFKNEFPRSIVTSKVNFCPQFQDYHIREKAPVMIQCLSCKHCKRATYFNSNNYPKFIILCEDKTASNGYKVFNKAS